MRRNASRDTGKSVPVGIGIGTAASFAVTVIGALVIAWLLNGQQMGEEQIGYGVLIVTILSVAVGCITAMKLTGHHALMVSIATGICYFLLLIACTALVFGGQYQGVVQTALMIIGTGLATALIGTHHKTGKKTHLRKTGNR